MKSLLEKLLLGGYCQKVIVRGGHCQRGSLSEGLLSEGSLSEGSSKGVIVRVAKD